jgi:hypothetical protein
MQHDESPKQDYLPDPSISEEGPWHFYVEKGRVTGIGSHDFTHDAMFSLSGDFSNNEERLRYANEIVSRLNAYGKVIKPDNAVETHEALRSLVDHMDYLYDVGEMTFTPQLAQLLTNCRTALACHATSRRRANLSKMAETLDAISKKLGVEKITNEQFASLGVDDSWVLEQLLHLQEGDFEI